MLDMGYRADLAEPRVEVLSAATAGIMAGTRLATRLGWRDAAAIAPGDAVLTFDRGMQPVRRVTRLWIAPPAGRPAGACPVLLGPGAVDNDGLLAVLPGQPVLIESDAAERLTDDPFPALPALCLEGCRHVTFAGLSGPILAVRLHFDRPEAVFSRAGVMLCCPGGGEDWDADDWPCPEASLIEAVRAERGA